MDTLFPWLSHVGISLCCLSWKISHNAYKCDCWGQRNTVETHRRSHKTLSLEIALDIGEGRGEPWVERFSAKEKKTNIYHEEFSKSSIWAVQGDLGDIPGYRAWINGISNAWILRTQWQRANWCKGVDRINIFSHIIQILFTHKECQSTGVNGYKGWFPK